MLNIPALPTYPPTLTNRTLTSEETKAYGNLHHTKDKKLRNLIAQISAHPARPYLNISRTYYTLNSELLTPHKAENISVIYNKLTFILNILDDVATGITGKQILTTELE